MAARIRHDLIANQRGFNPLRRNLYSPAETPLAGQTTADAKVIVPSGCLLP